MREILPGIFTWSWFAEPKGYNFNGHLIRHAEGNLCIDPVEPAEQALEQIVREGVSRILLTNRNHSRAANRIRALTGACAAIHPADAAFAREQGGEIDDELVAGERIGPLHVKEAAGKSPGEVVFHWPERRLLFVGDVVIGHPSGACGILPDHLLDDPARLRRSVRGLLDLDFEVMLVGDGESILNDAKDRLAELVDGFAA